LGDPFAQIGKDLKGRVSIDWGVYGLPETFLVNKQGLIVYKHVGPLEPGILRDKIMPLVRKLQQEESTS
jgi:cytochrome c biogenesis protein CcmG/thiol:disulfide interchange protein DsbE